MGERPFLFCFPVFLFNSSACQLKRWNSFADVYIFPLSSFIFLAVLTPLKITSQRTHIHAPHLSCILKYTDLPPVLLLLQTKTVISKAEVLTDTIKQTFLNGSKETESTRETNSALCCKLKHYATTITAICLYFPWFPEFSLIWCCVMSSN